jgi:hypothetical protein
VQLKLAEVQNLIASLPGVADRPPQTLSAARLSVTRAVSFCLGLGLAACILAAAAIGDPGVFTVLAVLAGLLAYGSAILFARLKFLRTTTNRVLAGLGTLLASCALCVVILSVTLDWQVDFGTGQETSRLGNGPGAPVNVVQTHATEHAILVKIVAAWNAKRPPNGRWPTSAGVENGVVVSSYGRTDVSMPSDYTLKYTVTPDGLGYTVTVTDRQGVGEMFNQEYGMYSPTS